MPDRHIHAADSAIGVDDTVSVSTRTHLFLTWARIAIDQEAVAIGARAESNTDLEFGAGLVATVAAAFAVEAFYGALRSDLVSVPARVTQHWEQTRSARATRIYDVLRLTFKIKHRQNAWGKDLRWLFKVRNEAAHPGEKWGTPVMHPVGQGVAPVVAAYALETTARAVDIMFDVLHTSLTAATVSPL